MINGWEVQKLQLNYAAIAALAAKKIIAPNVTNGWAVPKLKLNYVMIAALEAKKTTVQNVSKAKIISYYILPSQNPLTLLYKPEKNQI